MKRQKLNVRSSFRSKVVYFVGIVVLLAIIVKSVLNAATKVANINLIGSGKALYVSTNGNDNANGTLSSPFKTFSKAQSVASYGDTIYLLSGTYYGTIDISKSGLNVIGKGAVVDAVNQHKAIYVHADNVNLSGFEAMHSNSHIVYVAGNNVRVSDMYIHDGIYENRIAETGYPAYKQWGSGLSIKWPSTNVTVDNVKIAKVYGEGLDMYGVDNIKVTNTTITDAFSMGFYIDNSKNITLERNFALCTGDDKFKRKGSNMSGFGMALEKLENWHPESNWGAQLNNIQIVNNISYGCGGIQMWGSEVGGGLVNAYIAHNSILNVPAKSSLWIESLPGNRDITIINNLGSGPFLSTTGATLISNLSGVTYTTSTLTPESMKPLNGKDKGKPSNVKSDFGMSMRDNAPDIGAWEIGASSSIINATPNPTSNSTLKPSVVPSPVVSISTNTKPLIMSSWFNLHATRGKRYSSEVDATDVNLKDKLSMTVTGLPEGISVSKCVREDWGRTIAIRCYISGISRKPGDYPITITAKDDKGGVSKGSYNFKVW